MSGPKSYSAPPRYSANVFDGKLNSIFKAQSQIRRLLDELDELEIDDSERGVHIDCRDFLAHHRERAREMLKSVSVNERGTFGQRRYRELKSRIDQAVNARQAFIRTLGREKQSFLDAKADYEAFVRHERHRQQARASFAGFRKRTQAYLRKYLADEHPQTLEDAVEAVQGVAVAFPDVPFERGFRKQADERKRAVEERVREAEQDVQTVRTEAGAEIATSTSTRAESSAKSGGHDVASAEEEAAELNEVLGRARGFIAEVDDPAARAQYEERLGRLRDSATFQEPYYYRELLDDLRREEKTRSRKTELRKKLRQLRSSEVHPDCKAQRKNLQETARQLLDKDQLRAYEVEHFEGKYAAFRKENRERLEDAFVQRKEVEFLKQEIVESLEDRDYEVMDDLEVIDFEQESDFLLQVPKQENYINLTFDPDGSFRYRFLISEEKEALNIDEKKRKLTQMGSACSSFKEVLDELSEMGLPLEMDEDRPVSEDALISVPERHRDKVKTPEKQKRKRKRADSSQKRHRMDSRS